MPYLKALKAQRGTKLNFRFSATLPEIIGFVPEEEQSAFADFQSADLGDTFLVHRNPGKPGLAALADTFPETFRQIAADLSLVTAGRSILRTAFLQRRFTLAGRTPRYGKPHIEPSRRVTEIDRVAEPYYLVSSFNPTPCFVGRVSLHQPGATDVIRLKPDSLDPHGEFVAPPAFAIVRQGAATVHTSPEFEENAWRTFMQVSPELAA